MIHWPVSTRGENVRMASCGRREVALGVEEQGLDLSDKKTPRSRASCSRVIGMKDPTPQMTKTL